MGWPNLFEFKSCFNFWGFNKRVNHPVLTSFQLGNDINVTV